MIGTMTLRDLADERVALDDLLALDAGEETLEAEALATELAAKMVQKVDAFASYVREREATVAAIDDEITRLKARRTAIANDTARLLRYAQFALEAMDRPKVSGTLFTLALQLNPPRVVVPEDVTTLPDEFVRLVPATIVPDKEAIRDALKAGQDVPGCFLERTQTLRIR